MRAQIRNLLAFRRTRPNTGFHHNESAVRSQGPLMGHIFRLTSGLKRPLTGAPASSAAEPFLPRGRRHARQVAARGGETGVRRRLGTGVSPDD